MGDAGAPMHCSCLPLILGQAHVSSAWKTAMTGSSWVVTTSTLRNLSKSMSSCERLVFSLYMISSRWWRPRKYCRSLEGRGGTSPGWPLFQQPLSGPQAKTELVRASQRPRRQLPVPTPTPQQEQASVLGLLPTIVL